MSYEHPTSEDLRNIGKHIANELIDITEAEGFNGEIDAQKVLDGTIEKFPKTDPGLIEEILMSVLQEIAGGGEGEEGEFDFPWGEGEFGWDFGEGEGGFEFGCGADCAHDHEHQ